MTQRRGKPNQPGRNQTAKKEQPPTAGIPTPDASKTTKVSATEAGKKEKQVNATPPARLARLWRAIHSRITANRVMAAFTIVLAGIGYLQYLIYRSQLAETRIGQRPWLAVKYQPPVMPKVGESVCVGIVLMNTGKTPAKHIESIAVARVVPIGEEIDFRYPPISLESGRSGPGIPTGVFATTRIGVLSPDDPLPLTNCIMQGSPAFNSPEAWSDAKQEQFNRGEIFIETHGEFTYEDAGGRAHWTRFCETIPGGNAPRLKDVRSCVAYNSIDDNND